MRLVRDGKIRLLLLSLLLFVLFFFVFVFVFRYGYFILRGIDIIIVNIEDIDPSPDSC